MSEKFSNEEIRKKLNSIISYALRIDPDKVTAGSRIIADLKAESLDILDIRFSVEQEFGFKLKEHEIIDTIGKDITSTEFIEVFTVSSLAYFIENKLKQQESVLEK
jgi:acyl carrier protein